MIRGYVPLLLIVAGIWGASYLFIKVAVREIEPTAMMDLRLLLAAAVLVPVVAIRLGVRGAAAEIRATGRGAFILGVTNMAFPFVLIGVGVLTGLHPQGGWWGVAGTLAVVVASLSYAAANLYTQHRFPGTSPLVITTSSTIAGALV